MSSCILACYSLIPVSGNKQTKKLWTVYRPGCFLALGIFYTISRLLKVFVSPLSLYLIIALH